jgi:hypothetical protein
MPLRTERRRLRGPEGFRARQALRGGHFDPRGGRAKHAEPNQFSITPAPGAHTPTRWERSARGGDLLPTCKPGQLQPCGTEG